MKKLTLLLLSTLVVVGQKRDYPVKPVPFTAVKVTDSFWAPRIETNRKVTIPFAFQKDEETRARRQFPTRGEGTSRRDFENHRPPPYPFDDTDLYKVIEGAAYTLSVHPDPQLEAYLDKDDCDHRQRPRRRTAISTRRAPSIQRNRMGGLGRIVGNWKPSTVTSCTIWVTCMKLPVAHYQATGKRTLLDIALKTANLLDQTFGPGKQVIWPGHQITEMGLAKLYRATGEESISESREISARLARSGYGEAARGSTGGTPTAPITRRT
jgi:DUF1680 family protein